MTQTIDQFAYPAFTLPFVILWIFSFIRYPRFRMPMLCTSALYGLAGPLCELWSLQDYWHPDYWLPLEVGKWRFGIEDYILTFAMVGTAMALFEQFGTDKKWGSLPSVSSVSFYRLYMIGCFGISLMILFNWSVNIKSMHATLLTFLITCTFMYWRRPIWILRMLPVASGFALFYWCVFRFIMMPLFPGIVDRWWNLEVLWGIYLAGVPLEEPLWAFGVALFAGPVYRLCSTEIQ
jgi:hypothetical protein